MKVILLPNDGHNGFLGKNEKLTDNLAYALKFNDISDAKNFIVNNSRIKGQYFPHVVDREDIPDGVINQNDYENIQEWVNNHKEEIKNGKEYFNSFPGYLSLSTDAYIKISTGRARDAFKGEKIEKGKKVLAFGYSVDQNYYTCREIKIDIEDMII